MTDFTKILSKAKELESKMKESQEKIKNITAEGEAGSNSVKVTLNGENEMIKITLSDEIMKEDKVVVEDLILAESIYQNNFYGENVKFNSGITKVNRGQCIERELAMMKVSLNS